MLLLSEEGGVERHCFQVIFSDEQAIGGSIGRFGRYRRYAGPGGCFELASPPWGMAG
jgi:hypothetical protein